MEHIVSYVELHALAGTCAVAIRDHFGLQVDGLRTLAVYPVPRGGIPATLALKGFGLKLELVNDPAVADFIMDDLIDTGETVLKFAQHRKPFFALIDKRETPDLNNWVVWPWEGDAPSGIEDHVRRLIQYAGDDPTREGLSETPLRVAKAWQHWCGGYAIDPTTLLKTFVDGSENVSEMVLERDIPFYSHCEHHMAPFFGTATIGYIPNGKIIGLSKMNRLVDAFARRLQVQERLTTQIADAMAEGLGAKGVGVIITARHMCIESRGVAQQGTSTTTSALRGVMLEGNARQEFLMLAK